MGPGCAGEGTVVELRSLRCGARAAQRPMVQENSAPSVAQEDHAPHVTILAKADAARNRFPPAVGRFLTRSPDMSLAGALKPPILLQPQTRSRSVVRGQRVGVAEVNPGSVLADAG